MADTPSRVPAAEPARLDPKKTAVLVLDMTLYKSGSNPHHEHILPRLAEFLERARAIGVPLVFTGAVTQAGQPVEPALKHRPEEPLIYPDSFDKFRPGELRTLLPAEATDLVITGGAVNMAVLYTATAAARDEHYQAYIPLDGVYTPDEYRYEYALYQLTLLPGAVIPVRFTRLADISFG